MPQNGRTALHWACYQSEVSSTKAPEFVAWLVQSLRIDVGAVDIVSASVTSCVSGRVWSFTLVHLLPQEGRTAFFAAFDCGHSPIVRWFLENSDVDPYCVSPRYLISCGYVLHTVVHVGVQ